MEIQSVPPILSLIRGAVAGKPMLKPVWVIVAAILLLLLIDEIGLNERQVMFWVTFLTFFLPLSVWMEGMIRGSPNRVGLGPSTKGFLRLIVKLIIILCVSSFFFGHPLKWQPVAQVVSPFKPVSEVVVPHQPKSGEIRTVYIRYVRPKGKPPTPVKVSLDGRLLTQLNERSPSFSIDLPLGTHKISAGGGEKTWSLTADAHPHAIIVPF